MNKPDTRSSLMPYVAGVLSILLLLLAVCGCGRAKRLSEDRVEVASNTFVVVTKELRPGAIEASIHTHLSVKWPSSGHLDSIGEVDSYNGTEEIGLNETGRHFIIVYGRSLFIRPVKDGKWAWWPPQNALTIPPPKDNSIASYLRDWFMQAGWTNFQYEANGQHHEERITFVVPDTGQQFTIGSGQNGAWRTMPYRFASADESANAVSYKTDIPSLPSILVFTGPPNYFGAWSFDRATTEKLNLNQMGRGGASR